MFLNETMAPFHDPYLSHQPATQPPRDDKEDKTMHVLPKCVWIDNILRRWTPSGCSTVLPIKSRLTTIPQPSNNKDNHGGAAPHNLECRCNHLTEFVVFKLQIRIAEDDDDVVVLALHQDRPTTHTQQQHSDTNAQLLLIVWSCLSFMTALSGLRGASSYRQIRLMTKLLKARLHDEATKLLKARLHDEAESTAASLPRRVGVLSAASS